MSKPRKKLTVVRDVAEIPSFSSEDEEREWWATHELSDQLYDQLKPGPDDLRELKDILPTECVEFEVEGLPPVYGAAQSILSDKHPHAKRVTTLKQGAARAMERRRRFDGPIVLEVSQTYVQSSMADAANILGAISNTLEGIVYGNDAQIREIHLDSKPGERAAYTVRIRSRQSA